jgi:carboxypeptidase family protein/TonB-dependent receptor-like protein
MKRRFERLAASVLAGMAVSSTVLAQETTTGSIAGRIVDPQGAVVPEAKVTLRSGQGARSLATDEHGQFLAPYLTPGLYAVRVERSGFKPLEQRDVRVRLGQRVELDYTLSVGAREELVDVTAPAPVVDTRSTTAGGVLDSDELLRLPIPRRLTSTLYMIPGVSSSSGTGDANPSIAGASGLDNQYVVDGVNITNPGFGGIGVYNRVFGSLGTGVTTDFIQETQVKTAGFEAEYGQATGGVVNVITRSGSNALHGSLFGYVRPAGLEGGWRQQQTEAGQVNTTRSRDLDVGISVGGPLLKDRLFLFGAFNPQYETRTLIAPEGFPLRSLGEVDRKRRSLSYAGKLTWQLEAQHRLDLTAFGDPSHGDPGPQRPDALLAEDADRFSELRTYGGHNQALRYSGVLDPKWWLEVTAALARTRHEEVASVDEWRVTDVSVVPSVLSGGLGRYAAGTEGRNAQLALKSTHVLGGGAHELRYGIQLEDIEFTALPKRTGPSFTFPDGIPSRTGVTVTARPDPVYGRIYTAEGNRGDPAATTQQYLSGFAQDTWRVGSRLTLRPGIRWERQRIAGGRPLCYSDESAVGAGDGTPGSEINCEYTWTNNWGPRLGATFDVTGRGRSKLYVSWGRYYAKIPNDLAVRAMGAEPTASADYFDAALTRPVPSGVRARGLTNHFRIASGRPSQFVSGSRSTYHDERVAGFEIEAAPALSLGVRYVHRRLSRVLEDYSQAQPVLYHLEFAGLDQVTYVIGNIDAGIETIDATSIGVPRAFFEDPVHTYDAVELTAQKSFTDHWSLFGSYRWSRLRGNYEGFYRADNLGSDPALSSLFDFPTNDPSYTQIGVPQFGYRGDIRYMGTTLGQGPLPNDRTHQLKLYGARAWRRLTAGLALRAGSGQPLTALAANPAYGEPYDIPETLRGAGFETADGFRRRAPAEMLLDLHLDYTIPFGAARRLVLVADVFNLTGDRDPVGYDPGTEVLFGVPNPDFGTPRNPADPASPFATPRQVRLGARLEW